MHCNDDGLVVVGAGLMRTGTNSLQLALQHLLNGKCYHMFCLMENLKDANFWLAATSRNPSDQEWRAFFADYKAAVDFPVIAFYKELIEVYPDAKVVLTVRDPEHWVQSLKSTVAEEDKAMHSFPKTITNRLFGMTRFDRMIEAVSVRFLGDTTDRLTKEQLITAYHRHVEEVKRVVPEERLLIFEVKDGWRPLCDFLGLSVPDVPFPHVNNTKEFASTMNYFNRPSLMSLMGIGLFFAGVGFILHRRINTG